MLVEGAGAERATGRLLVHEHGSLAVRAGALAHRRRLGGLVRHRGCRARGERSHPVSAAPVPTLNRGGGPVSSSPREAILGARRTRPLYPVRGKPRRPTRQRNEALPKGGPRGRVGSSVWVSGGGLPALSLAARHVAVHGLVLPAELPLVVTRELRLTPSLGADAVARVLPVRTRERPDRCSPVPLLCHVVHFLSDGTGGRLGCRSRFARSSNGERHRFIPRDERRVTA